MKLSQARAIHRNSQKTPLIAVGNEQGDKYGRQAEMQICGDNLGYYLMGNVESTKWWVAHFVYGGSYAEGASPKEAAQAFANKLKWLPEEKKKRRLAAKIVEKYGEGPVVTQEGPTWIARLQGEIVAKAQNYSAAMKMAMRVEKELRNAA